MHNYYAEREVQLLEQFDRNSGAFIEPLSRHLGLETARRVLVVARDEYRTLIPQLPYIGGEDNPLTTALVISAELLAVYRAASRDGLAARELGRIVYDAAEGNLAQAPKSITLGERAFARFCDDRRRWAIRSQRREFPGDWVYTTRDGDGDTDFFLDYNECGIVKFFRAQGAGEFVRYMCLLDFPTSRAMGSGLMRVHTIAAGDPLCDFRFKRGRPVSQGWPAEDSAKGQGV